MNKDNNDNDNDLAKTPQERERGRGSAVAVVLAAATPFAAYIPFSGPPRPKNPVPCPPSKKRHGGSNSWKSRK